MISPTEFDAFLGLLDDEIDPDEMIHIKKMQAKDELYDGIEKIMDILREGLERRITESKMSEKLAASVVDISPILDGWIQPKILSYQEALRLNEELQEKVDELNEMLLKVEAQRKEFAAKFAAIGKQLGDKFAEPSYVAPGAFERLKEGVSQFVRERALGRKETDIGGRYSHMNNKRGWK